LVVVAARAAAVLVAVEQLVENMEEEVAELPAQVDLYPSPPDSPTYTLVYYAIKRIQDAGAYTNTADISFRFLPCLTAALAYYLAIKKAPDRVQMLKAFYEEEFARAAMEDRDRASVYLVPTYSSWQ
jgi:hypothetical protein